MKIKKVSHFFDDSPFSYRGRVVFYLLQVKYKPLLTAMRSW